MYDFKHQNNLSVDKKFTQTIKKEDSLNKIQNILFYIVILLFIFMTGLFTFNSYQKKETITIDTTKTQYSKN